MVEMREQGTKAKQKGQRAVVEYGVQRLKVETRDPHAKMELGSGRSEANPYHQIEQTEDKPRD